jgi:hypothetical protein
MFGKTIHVAGKRGPEVKVVRKDAEDMAWFTKTLIRDLVAPVGGSPWWPGWS